MIPLSDAAIQERDEIIESLSALLKSATDAELEYISQADKFASARDGQKHLAALRTVIFKRHGRMTEKHSWFPMEVVDLVANEDDEHDGRAFEIATGLAMLGTMNNDDAEGMMSYRWQQFGWEYLAVDPEWLGPILRGFVWLSENVTEWTFLQDPDKVARMPDRDEIERMVAGQSPTEAAEAQATEG